MLQKPAVLVKVALATKDFIDVKYPSLQSQKSMGWRVETDLIKLFLPGRSRARNPGRFEVLRELAVFQAG